MTVANNLNADFALFERYFKNLVGEIAVLIKFVEGFGEQLSLERQVHADRAIKTDKPGMERYVGILTFAPRRAPRSTKISTVLRYQNPILVQQNPFQLPVLPARLADPHDMRGVVVAPLAGHQSKF